MAIRLDRQQLQADGLSAVACSSLVLTVCQPEYPSLPSLCHDRGFEIAAGAGPGFEKEARHCYSLLLGEHPSAHPCLYSGKLPSHPLPASSMSMAPY